MARSKRATQAAQSYQHPESDQPLRPDAGIQPQFPKHREKSPKTYRYDSSLAPTLSWDTQPARQKAEDLIAEIMAADSLEAARSAAAKLKAMSQPFLNWAGKGDRQSFEVPTLPLFVHERLSTEAIIATLAGHKKAEGDQLGLDLWGDPQHSITDQILKAYEHRDEWTNRMVLGDSLVVMNSLLEYEGLGGQVQMIYIDPPYGVKFGSNFQPFVRKRDVKHNEDQDLTREPEMVKAYRDTWELGLHSYLSYLRDRLVLARELLTESGSVFVQISDENLHHVRELMDEVFGSENFVVQISIQKTGSQTGEFIQPNADFVIWFAKDKTIANTKFNKLFLERKLKSVGGSGYTMVELPNGRDRSLTEEEFADLSLLPQGSKVWRAYPLTSDGYRPTTTVSFEFDGRTYHPGQARHWGVSVEDLRKVAKAGRIIALGNQIHFKRYFDDFPIIPLSAYWDDLGGVSNRIYAVQTNTKAVERCLLMTTTPGDLVLDLTCGSGTTAYVAEQWGRRWITCDVSRVPLALARQRLLTATYPYYQLKDEQRGPAGGFVYRRKQNSRGEEIGGIVPHITVKSIANNELADEEVLVNCPEVVKGITRVTGAFTVEGTIPTPTDLQDQEENGNDTQPEETDRSFTDRLLEVLRKTPVLRLEGNRTVSFKQIRRPVKSLSLSAEAVLLSDRSEQNGNGHSASQPLVAFVFGSENGAIAERLVFQAAIEARAKSYLHLYVIGFAIHPNARKLIENCEEMTGIPATYVQATPDLMMGDLLKNMKSSQIFSVCGLPDISIQPVEDKYRVALIGLDVFDPVTMEACHRRGDEVPAWFLDSDYNGLVFRVDQAFFPKTGAWDNLKKALRATYEESLWGHLSGTISAPFEAGNHRQIAVKVIDERGNELLVVKSLD